MRSAFGTAGWIWVGPDSSTTLSPPPRLTHPLPAAWLGVTLGQVALQSRNPVSFQSAADGEAVWGETAQQPRSAPAGPGKGSRDSHLGEAGERQFWAFLQAMAGTSSCEKSQVTTKFPNLLRDYKVYHRSDEPVSPRPHTLKSQKRRTCLERQLDGVQGPGWPADDRQGHHVLAQVHLPAAALGRDAFSEGPATSRGHTWYQGSSSDLLQFPQLQASLSANADLEAKFVFTFEMCRKRHSKRQSG